MNIVASQDYPLLNLFWTMLWLFIWVLWIFLLIRIISDIFRSHMSGFSKAMWLLFVIILPFLGVLIYLIARGDDMHKRELKDAQANEEAFQSYIKQTAGSGASSAEEITKLAALKDQGVLTEAEFQAQKAKLLA